MEQTKKNLIFYKKIKHEKNGKQLSVIYIGWYNVFGTVLCKKYNNKITILDYDIVTVLSLIWEISLAFWTQHNQIYHKNALHFIHSLHNFVFVRWAHRASFHLRFWSITYCSSCSLCYLLIVILHSQNTLYRSMFELDLWCFFD